MADKTGTKWPSVPVGEYGYMRCPLPLCDSELFLTRTYCISLVAEQDTDLEAKDAISDGWEVECLNGHKILTNLDAARAHNAAIEDPDSEDFVDETGESSIAFDLMLLHERIHAIAGDFDGAVRR